MEGKTNNEKGSIAGSVITMLDAVKLMLEIGFTEVQVAKMSALNPAKLLGTQKTNGSIKLGKNTSKRQMKFGMLAISAATL